MQHVCVPDETTAVGHVGLCWTQGLGAKGIVHARPSYADFPQRLKNEKPEMRGGVDRVLNALGILHI